MWFVKLIAGLAGIYAIILVLVYFAQTWLIFPTGLASRGAPPLPAGAERIEIETADGEQLAGTLVPPRDPSGRDDVLILGFGGNAWNADALVGYLNDLFPDRPVAAFHYRGYAPSSGRPSAAAILDDALAVHDHLATRFADARIVAAGLSIGAGPAARLAAERPVAGAILVTPFDSLTALARHHYPWLPVGTFLRHRMPVAEILARSPAPVAIITAGQDTIIPAARSAPVAAAARNLVLEREIGHAGHNDLYASPDFAAAMREALARIEGGG
jgi:uncharacterized protein